MSSILAGVSRHPSTTSVTGSSRAADSNVMMLNKLKLSSCTGCSPSTGGALAMSFLENTLRDWKVRLEPMADKKPRQLKVASLMDAIATPPMMGSRVATTKGWGCSPRNRALKATLKAGSMALIVCVKETATAPRLTLVSRFPSVCTIARGSTLMIVLLFTVGRFTMPVIQNSAASVAPTTNCTVVHVRGCGKALSTNLLYMLNWILNKYHPANREPRARVLTMPPLSMAA
mmetsp:Transcript_20262/g.56455  ORF Transcript_20262/g.56455 Transcript_20262/m.56455 type:complete len:231 (-) Transcript_20262:325-1017(-)